MITTENYMTHLSNFMKTQCQFFTKASTDEKWFYFKSQLYKSIKEFVSYWFQQWMFFKHLIYSETILSFRYFILPINGITIKKYLGMFSVEMRAILINVFAAINYHSAKNLHFPIKICLTINAILTETIHNHFMGRRKLEQQNKVNYPTKICSKILIFLPFSLSHILPKKILLYNKATKIFAISTLIYINHKSN